MKKYIGTMLAAFALALAFTGCPGIDTPIPGPGNLTGLDDVQIMAGLNPGSLSFSFSATEPNADTYTLYVYAEGSAHAARIINYGTPKSVEPRTYADPGKINGLTPGITYSVVLVARKANHEDLTSGAIRVDISHLPGISGLSDLEVMPGGTPGSLLFSFSATDPAADTYTMYFIAEAGADAERIIEHGSYEDVEPHAANAPGAINNRTVDTTYSVVVVARKAAHRDLVSSVRQVTTSISGLTDFEAGQGLEPGSLTYSFNATIPAADTYTMYFIAEAGADAGRIIEHGSYEDVEPHAANAPGTLALTPGTTYSVVVVARIPGFAYLISSVIQVTTRLLPGVSGLDDLEVVPGLTPGSLNFSFSETDPAADTYTMYFIAEAGADAERIIEHGSHEDVAPHAVNAPGVISGLAKETVFSVVVVARKTGHEDLVSRVIQVATSLTGLTDLEVRGGIYSWRENPIELIYSFSATVPPAEAYFLYFIAEEGVSAARIMEAGSHEVVAAGELGGTIEGLTPNAAYSVVVVARKPGFSDLISSVMPVVTPSLPLADLVVRRGSSRSFGTRGATNPTELVYSFAAVYPAADSYTLYFINQATSNPADVIGNNGRLVEPRPADSPGYITGPGTGVGPDDHGFSVNGSYSIVVVARRAGHEDLVSEVMPIGRVPNNILTVSGSMNPDIIVSALIANLSTSNPGTFAVGYRIPGTGMFVFYLLDGPCLGPANPDSGQFDPENPWTGEGNLFITLATHEAADEGRQYIQGSSLFGAIPIPSRQNNLFRNTDRVTRQWSNFVLNPL